MFGALGIGRNGLHANQYKLDAVSDEIANANTNGYKKSQVSFQELLLDEDTSVGVKSGIHKIDFKQGTLNNTGFKWDLAIEGDGFFSVSNENGESFLKRDGSFQITNDGRISDYVGNIFEVEFNDDIAEFNRNEMQVNSEGILTAIIDDEIVSVGRIPLFMPERPQEIRRVGENLYLPGEGDNLFDSVNNPEMFGVIAPGFIENSNSDLVRAMSDMITTQRAYSLNSQAIRSTDDIMRVINEIKK